MARAHAQTRTPKVPVRDQTRIQGEAQPRKKRPRRRYHRKPRGDKPQTPEA